MEKCDFLILSVFIIAISCVQSANVPAPVSAAPQVLPPPAKQSSSIKPEACAHDEDCNNGVCKNGTCICEKGFLTVGENWCSYQQRNKLTAFLLSILVGAVGADWFYLANGNTGYIVAGVFKLLTGGGFGIWYTVDWIRLLVDSFKDGNGYALNAW